MPMTKSTQPAASTVKHGHLQTEQLYASLLWSKSAKMKKTTKKTHKKTHKWQQIILTTYAK